MIDDRVEEGMNEEEAVKDLGSIDNIIDEIIKNVPLTKIVKQRIKPKHVLQTWEVILLILGFPLWFPLLLAFSAILLSIYLVIFSISISFLIIYGSIGFVSVMYIIKFIFSLVNAEGTNSLVYISIAFVCLGLFLFISMFIKSIFKFLVKFTKKGLVIVKKIFVYKKEK